MARTHEEWTVLDHGPLEALAENVWRVEGAVPGMSLRRVMTIARMNDGRLVFHSPVALRDAAMREVESLGTPGFIVVPSGQHRLDAPLFKKRYPEARVFAPKGSRKKISDVLAVDGTYEEFAGDDAVRLEPLRGVKDAEGAMIVLSGDGVTLVLNDVVFNMPKKPSDFLGWAILSVMGSAPGPRVSRLFKLLVVDDANALRADLNRLAALPRLQRVVVSHGVVARGAEAAAVLKAAAAYLA